MENEEQWESAVSRVVFLIIRGSRCLANCCIKLYIAFLCCAGGSINNLRLRARLRRRMNTDNPFIKYFTVLISLHGNGNMCTLKYV
jgi:hypothetical protein